MNNIIKRKWNQNSMVIIEDLQGMAFQAESGGHTFQISGIDGEGNTVALSGTPAGVMLRADGQDVTLTCSVSEGVVSATLPANAYVVPGRFGLTIFLTSDGQKTAIYAAVGTVGKTSSGTVAPPAGSDVVDLVNQINTAIAAIPANYNACFAPAYSTSGLYSVGQYVTYNGNLYRCNTAITTAETWTAAHWTQTNLGADVYDLKSAFNTDKTIQEMKDGDVKYDFDYLTHGGIQANVTIGSVGETISTNTTSNYKHAIYAVTAGKLYRVNSRANANGTYKTAFATDANDVIKQIWQVIPPSNSDVTFDVLIPTGATKLYVNAYSQTGSQIACKQITYNSLQTQIDDNADIFDDFIGNMQYSTESSEYNYTGSITFAGVNGTAAGTALNFTTTSNYNYAVYTVEEGDAFVITTYGTTSDTYPYYCYLTDANNIIYSMELPKPSEEKYFSGTVVVPHGATKMYVLSRSAQTYRGTVYKVVKTPKVVDEIIREVEQNDDVKDPMKYNDGIRAIIGRNSGHGFINIGFITDTHGNEFNAVPSIGCASAIAETGITDIFLHGGDYATADGLTINQFMDAFANEVQKVKTIRNIVTLNGNHDLGKTATNLDVYQTSLLLKPYTNFSIIGNNSDPFKDYGYVDFDEYKIRIIYLNAYITNDPETVGFTKAQLDWLHDVALNLDAGWSVVAFTHNYGTRMTNIFNAFVDKGTQYGDDIFDKDANGELVAVIHGHHHADQYDTDGTTILFNYIGVDSGYAKNEANDDGAFDVFTVDTINKILYETRIGRGNSRSYNWGQTNSIIS